MKKYLLKLCVIFFAFLLTNNLFSQINNWEIYYESEDIKISFKYTNCYYSEQFDTEYVFFTIENKLNKKISVSWKESLIYNENEEKPIVNEFRKKIILEPYGIHASNCLDKNQMVIFSRFTEQIENMPGVSKIHKLTDFQLIEILLDKNIE